MTRTSARPSEQNPAGRLPALPNLLVFSMQVGTHKTAELAELIRLECRVFAAKMRAARAILGWSQSELGFRVGLTQRAVHKLEQGGTEPRRATACAIEAVWTEQGIEFEDLGDGGFRVSVRAQVLDGKEDRAKRQQRRQAPISISASARPS